MTPEEIIEGNRLIAEFMVERSDLLFITFSSKYHKLWDWLMPVVEKIESMGHPCKICLSHTEFLHCHSDTMSITWPMAGTSKIESVYDAVLTFIKWYNNQTNQQ